MARISTIAAWLSCVLLIGCSKPSENQAVNATENATAAAAPAPAPAAPPVAPQAIQDSLVSIASGAYAVIKPREYSRAYNTISMIDQDATSNWSSPSGDLAPETMVLQLAGRALLKTLQFDCAEAITYAGACARNVTVEVSDTGPESGFTQIAALQLGEGKDNQTFPVAAPQPGRWVRLTIKDNHGSTDFIQLNDFRASGDWLSRDPMPDITGTWDTDWGDFHAKQQGTAVTGCYYTRGGVYQGGVEGSTVKFSWCENCGTSSEGRGSATVAVAPDGKSFTGLFWNEGSPNHAEGGVSGTRKSNDPGSCPNWKQGGIGEQMASELEKTGRVRIQGINFDSDSGVIRPESHALLDEIVKMAKARPSWKLVVEGHTDTTSTPVHNQDLSERRARAVVAYLTAGGVEAARLTAQGFGATKPIADNGSPFGRAQNRRVELVRS